MNICAETLVLFTRLTEIEVKYHIFVNICKNVTIYSKITSVLVLYAPVRRIPAHFPSYEKYKLLMCINVIQ